MRIRLSSFIILLSSFALLANASGLSSLHSLEQGSVSITNTQKNSSWFPAAILFRFDAPVSATLTVSRQTAGGTFQLSTVDLSDNQHAVWIPEAPYPFNLNDVLSVTSTATNGTVEIIRKADQ